MKIISKIQKWWFGKRFETKELNEAHEMTVKQLLDEIHLIRDKKSILSHKKRMAILNRYESVMQGNYINRK